MDTAVIERSFGGSPEPRRWTADEFLRAAELGLFGEDERLELLDGEIYQKMSPIGVEHGICVTRLTRWLMKVTPSSMGLWIQTTTHVSLSSVPEPDLAVLRKPEGQFKKHPESSEIALVIEVADSSLGLDRGRKGRIYGSSGIEEYWVVNLRDRVLEVHREPTKDGYGFMKRYAEGEMVQPLCMDALLMISQILPDAE